MVAQLCLIASFFHILYFIDGGSYRKEYEGNGMYVKVTLRDWLHANPSRYPSVILLAQVWERASTQSKE